MTRTRLTKTPRGEVGSFSACLRRLIAAVRRCVMVSLGFVLPLLVSGCYAGVAAVVDSLMIVAGYATFAVTTLLTERSRQWDLIRVFLSTGETSASRLPRDADCRLCGPERSAGS